MFDSFIQHLLGNNTDRELKKMWPIVRHINDLEPQMTALSDSSLQAKTFEFKERLQKGKRWMIFCRKPLLSCVKHRGVFLACAILMYSFWAALCCTAGILQK